ncbi:MAG: asparagine--tRNA ligase [Cytophagales bacterium]|jgi:asparaginyl-tRNA synthetase|nr:asparagine--tRNA ligase [Cytophagales bacterium]
MLIKDVLHLQEEKKNLVVRGWVKTKRESKNLTFIMLNDGSSIKELQLVVNHAIVPNEALDKINTGASLEVLGNLIMGDHGLEIDVVEIKNFALAADFPIQPKKHSMEFLRDLAHLRVRTTTFQSVFRIRNAICFAIHKFFQENDFIYVNTPIITANDAEGAGDLFTVTTLDGGAKDVKNDFFGKHANLTVSGQLEGETTIFGFNKIYTFGPTFRAENSNTARHLAEFWMIEPEMAFFDLKDNMDLAEKFLKYIYQHVKANCQEELEFLEERSLREKSESLVEKLKFAFENNFTRITYTEAIDILQNCDENKNGTFAFKVEKWGGDIQTEHEKFLTEKYFKGPVIVNGYPSAIKAFYMKQNPDKKTAAAMDVLLPGIGEIIGGSQREENLDILLQIIRERNIDEASLQWYLDTRRYGSIVHSGFGLGLERLVLFITGMDNIRDVILYPRTPGRIV